MLYKIVNSLKVDTNAYKLVNTSNLMAVTEVCKAAKANHHMYGLVGCTGSGKTTALKRFYKANKNVSYVECKHTMNCKQLLKELGINYVGTVYDMVTRIEEEFNSLENPLLIIDEAGKLSHNLILDLHDLRNSTMNSLGLVLAGCEYFKDNLENGVRKDKQGIPEFYSRIITWQILGTPSKVEVHAIMNANNVDINTVDKKRFNNFREVYNVVSEYRISGGISLECFLTRSNV